MAVRRSRDGAESGTRCAPEMGSTKQREQWALVLGMHESISKTLAELKAIPPGLSKWERHKLTIEPYARIGHVVRSRCSRWMARRGR